MPSTSAPPSTPKISAGFAGPSDSVFLSPRVLRAYHLGKDGILSRAIGKQKMDAGEFQLACFGFRQEQ
jgi:hypothetical protein